MIGQRIVDNGINEVKVYTDKKDMLVMSKNRLLAAIELKSHPAIQIEG